MSPLRPTPTNRLLALSLAGLAHLSCLATLVYGAAFVGDLGLARSASRGPAVEPVRALAIDLSLLVWVGVQLVWTGRAAFRRRWSRRVPRPMERSTRVLLGLVPVWALLLLWHPLPMPIWTVADPVARLALATLSWTGWGLVLASTFLVDHLALCGLRQALSHARGEWLPRTLVAGRPLLAGARHPLTLGLFLAIWSTPDMGAGRLLFAAGLTVCALIAIQLEEHDRHAEQPHEALRSAHPLPVQPPDEGWGTREPKPPPGARW